MPYLTPKHQQYTVLLMPYLIIAIVVLLASPFILKIAQSQEKENKRNLRNLLLLILITQIGLGVLNWENFSTGRNGNVIGLNFINKDKNLLKKYFRP